MEYVVNLKNYEIMINFETFYKLFDYLPLIGNIYLQKNNISINS
jgi:hypothetical protein